MRIRLLFTGLVIAMNLQLFAQSETTTDQPAAKAAEAVEPQRVQEPERSDGASGEEDGEEVLDKLKKTVDVLGRMKLSGYLQAQYVNDESSSDELTGSGSRNRDQFSVRRARIKFTYQVSPNSRLVFAPDVSSSGATLKDGWIDFTEPWTSWKNTLTAGQFNWPFGFEIGYSSSSRELPERSRVTRALFPGERDRGVMLSGRGLDRRLSYNVAVVNGTGTASSSDLNSAKDIVGRIGYSSGPLALGVSAYRGEDLVATRNDPAGVSFDKERTGVDFQWTTPLRGLTFRGEYIIGKQAPVGGSARSSSHDVAGWYVYAVQRIGTRHDVALRLDEYDPDKDVAQNAIRTLGGSYIFHWDRHSKVMLAYETPRHQANDRDDNVFTMRYQYSF